MRKKSFKIVISSILSIAMLVLSFTLQWNINSSVQATETEVSDEGVPDPAIAPDITDTAMKFGADEDEFPIGLWTPNNSDYFSENVYKDIAAANFNYVIGSDEIYGNSQMTGAQMIDTALDYAEKYHIKMWLNEPLIRQLGANETSRIDSIISAYKNKKAFMGVILRDEPDVSVMESMVPFDRELKKVAPDTHPLINLLSDAATPSQLGVPTWEEYIDRYIRMYEPKYLMYDFYPLLFESANIGYGLCKSMSTIIQKANDKKIPLWSNIQSVPGSIDAPDLTATDLKWQTYMNLALGAKGIVYWYYSNSRDTAQGAGLKPAIIDFDGNKTALYDTAVTLNQEVKDIGKILLKLDYKGVMIHNDAISKQSYELGQFNPISSLSGGGYTVGCFEDSQGSKKIMVVNLDRTANSIANIAMNSNSVEYYHLWRDGIRTGHWTASNNVISLNLEPGEGVFLELGPAKTIDLDLLAKTAMSSFVSTPYFLPADYIRTDANETITIKSATTGGTIAMGYHGSVYTDENLKVTARFGGDFATMNSSLYNAFYLRSQNNGSNLPEGVFAQDKYMFTFNNSGFVKLYRVIGSVLTELSSAIVPAWVDLTNENSYELRAKSVGESILLTLQINGTRIISYADSSPDRIMTAGNFGVAANANNSTITLGKLTTIDLDEMVKSIPSNFMSTPYFTSADYYKSVENNTLSIKSSSPAGTIAMGYHGAGYLNENLRITTKFDGTFSAMDPGVWDAFYLRSLGNGSNLPTGYFTMDKYMFTVPASGNIQLHRMNDEVLTYLAPSIMPSNIDLTAENTYDLSAVNYTDYVEITLKINGVTAINYKDTSALRITTAGYFGVAAYGNDSTITLGKHITVDMDINIKERKALFMSSPYFNSSDYLRKDDENTITFNALQTGGTITNGYHAATYQNEKISITAKFGGEFEAMSQYVWNAFYLRSQNNGSSLPTGTYSHNKYMFTINNTGIINLYRVIDGVQVLLASGTVPMGTVLTDENTYVLCAKNSTDNVTISLDINGSNAITHSDVATDRISLPGYFGTCAYANNSTITLGKTNNNIIVPKIVDMDKNVLNYGSDFTSTPYFAPSEYIRTNSNSTIAIRSAPTGGTIVMGYHKNMYLNDSIRVTARFIDGFSSLPASVFDAFYLRSQGGNASNLPFGQFSLDKYMFAIHSDGKITLYRVNSGVMTAISSGIVPSSIDFENENVYELGAITYSNRVDLSFKVNNALTIMCSDTSSNRIANEGFFGVAANANNSKIVIGKYSPIPTETTFDSKVMYDSANFISTPYFTPGQYVRTDANNTISIKSSTINGTVAVGYQAASYLNDKISITARFSDDFFDIDNGDFNAMYLRSQISGASYPDGSLGTNKYMFKFTKDKTITLCKVINGVLTEISTGLVPLTLDVTVENHYELSAINFLDRTDVSLSINDIKVISYSDSSADRITGSGYFGVVGYMNNSTIVLGELHVTIDLNEIIKNSTSNFTSSPYYAGPEYTRIDEGNTISIKSNDLSGVTLGYHGAAYLNDKLSFTAKFDGTFSTMNSWNAFYLRSQGNGTNLPIGYWTLDKYMFTIPNTKNIQLHRMNNKILTYLAPSNVPSNIDLTAENDYEICAVNNADSVDITMKINGVTVISYSDKSSDRIMTAGYFGMASYANSSRMTIGKYRPVLFGNYIISPTQSITSIQPVTTVNNFFTAGNSSYSNDTVFLFKSINNTSISGNTPVGTGTTLKATTTSGRYITYTIIIYGDLDGNGSIAIEDLTLLKQHLLNINSLQGAPLEAGNTYKTNVNTVTVSDILALRKHLLGLTQIIQ